MKSVIISMIWLLSMVLFSSCGLGFLIPLPNRGQLPLAKGGLIYYKAKDNGISIYEINLASMQSHLISESKAKANHKYSPVSYWKPEDEFQNIAAYFESKVINTFNSKLFSKKIIFEVAKQTIYLTPIPLEREKLLYFNEDSTFNVKIEIIDLNMKKRQVLYSCPGSIDNASLSPNNELLAFSWSGQNEESSCISIINLKNKKETYRLKMPYSIDGGISWSADNQRIIYSDHIYTPGSINIYDLNSKELVKVRSTTKGDQYYYLPRFLNEDWIIYGWCSGGKLIVASEIRACRIDGSDEKKLVRIWGRRFVYFDVFVPDDSLKK